MDIGQRAGRFSPARDALLSPQENVGVDAVVELDVVGAAIGSNKASVGPFAGDYLRHYEAAFAEFRHQPINLIEVGVAGGKSLALWKWYFSEAHIVGIDVNRSAKVKAGGRVTIHIGSQANPRFLSTVCDAHPPTIFIDDGSHLAQHNIFTFEHVFPRLLPGGVYVVEDLAFHFGANADRWQSDVKRNSPEYFLDLARSCMARQYIEGTETVQRYIVRMIDSVQFIGSAAIIRKRRSARSMEGAVEFGKSYIVENKLSGLAYERFALYLLTHGGPDHDIEAACAAAMEQGGRRLPVSYMRADVMLRSGRQAEAVQLVRQVLALTGEPTKERQEAADLLQRTGFSADAVARLRAILEAELGRVETLPIMDVLKAFKGAG